MVGRQEPSLCRAIQHSLRNDEMSAEDFKQMIYNWAVTLGIHPWVDSHPFPAGQEVSPQRLFERTAIKDELRKEFLPGICQETDPTLGITFSARNLP